MTDRAFQPRSMKALTASLGSFFGSVSLSLLVGWQAAAEPVHDIGVPAEATSAVGRAIDRAWEHANARRMMEAALALEEVPSGWVPDTPVGWPTYGDDLLRSGDLARMRFDTAAAQERYEKARAVFERRDARESPAYLAVSLRLAATYLLRDRAKTEEWLNTAEALVEDVLALPSAAKARSLRQLAEMYLADEPRKAEALYLAAIESARQVDPTLPVESIRLLLDLTVDTSFSSAVGSSDAGAILSELQQAVRKSIGEEAIEYSRVLRARSYVERLRTSKPEVQALMNRGDTARFNEIRAESMKNEERLLREACEILESLPGRKGREYVQCMSQLGSFYSSRGKAEGLEALQKAIEASELLYGRKDPFVLERAAGGFAVTSGQDRAISLALEALEIKRNMYGEDNPHVASSLVGLAGYHMQKYNVERDEKDREQAIEYYERYAEIQADFFGEGSSVHIGALNSMIYAYRLLDEERALKLTQKVEKMALTGGDETRSGMQNLVMVANHYVSVDRNHRKAMEILESVVNRGREAWGEDRFSQYERVASQLAHAYAYVGEFGKAVELYRDLLRADPGKNFARGLEIGLAGVYLALAQYSAAEELLLSLAEEYVGGGALAVSPIEQALGDLRLSTGSFEEAAEHYKTSLEVLVNGFSTIDVEGMSVFSAPKLYGRARAYQALGRMDEAGELYERVLKVGATARHLRGVARFYSKLGRFEEAEALFDRSVDRISHQVGDEHPEYATALMQKAFMYGAWGKPKDAVAATIRSLASLEAFVSRLALWASEGKLQTYAATVESRYDYLYSLLSAHFTGESPESSKALERHLVYKGRIAEMLSTRSRLALLSRDPELAKTIADLTDVTEQIAHLSLRPPEDMDSAEFSQFIGVLEKRRLELDELLARGASQYAEGRLASAIEVEPFIESLGEGVAYLDFVDYERYDLEVGTGTGERRYLVFFVGRDGDHKRVVRVEDLGPAERIDALVKRLRRSVVERTQKRRGLAIRPPPADSRPEAADAEDPAEALYRLLLAPFGAYLNGTDTLLLSASGSLNLIPFELLAEPGAAGYFGDRVLVVYGLGRGHYVASVMGEVPKVSGAKRRLSIVAAPDFSRNASDPAAAPRAQSVETVALARGATPSWPVTFDALPGTLREAEVIQLIAGSLEVLALTGDRASEGAVKSLEKPNILHLATHGFFLEDVQRQSEAGIGGIRAIRPQSGWVAPRAKPELANPLLRSGIALAGANRLALEEPIPRGEDDGILTASEVAAMDLHGTDLVVLSACETGLGEVKRGEGVFGLRRAFRIAGVRNIVMSLWNVPDEETVWLMEAFYRSLLKGVKPSAALNVARAAVRQRLTKRDGFAEPYFWGAFILEGTD